MSEGKDCTQILFHCKSTDPCCIFAQCQICDNDEIGLVCDESAVVTLNDCVLERNRLTPTQDRKKTVAIAEANKRKRLEEEYTSSFPLIAGTQRQ